MKKKLERLGALSSATIWIGVVVDKRKSQKRQQLHLSVASRNKPHQKDARFTTIKDAQVFRKRN